MCLVSITFLPNPANRPVETNVWPGGGNIKKLIYIYLSVQQPRVRSSVSWSPFLSPSSNTSSFVHRRRPQPHAFSSSVIFLRHWSILLFIRRSVSGPSSSSSVILSLVRHPLHPSSSSSSVVILFIRLSSSIHYPHLPNYYPLPLHCHSISSLSSLSSSPPPPPSPESSSLLHPSPYHIARHNCSKKTPPKSKHQ